MNWKTSFALIGLVLIGYFTGFHHHRYLTKNQIHRIAKTRLGPNSGFENHFYEKINATDEQIKNLSPIIQKRIKQLHQLNIGMVEKRKPVLDSMHLEMEAFLNDDQKIIMKKFIKRIRRFQQGRKKGKHRSPPNSF